jgi:hypothetical protein
MASTFVKNELKMIQNIDIEWFMNYDIDEKTKMEVLNV